MPIKMTTAATEDQLCTQLHAATLDSVAVHDELVITKDNRSLLQDVGKFNYKTIRFDCEVQPDRDWENLYDHPTLQKIVVEDGHDLVYHYAGDLIKLTARNRSVHFTHAVGMPVLAWFHGNRRRVSCEILSLCEGSSSVLAMRELMRSFYIDFTHVRELCVEVSTYLDPFVRHVLESKLAGQIQEVQLFRFGHKFDESFDADCLKGLQAMPRLEHLECSNDTLKPLMYNSIFPMGIGSFTVDVGNDWESMEMLRVVENLQRLDRLELVVRGKPKEPILSRVNADRCGFSILKLDFENVLVEDAHQFLLKSASSFVKVKTLFIETSGTDTEEAKHHPRPEPSWLKVFPNLEGIRVRVTEEFDMMIDCSKRTVHRGFILESVPALHKDFWHWA